MGIKNCKSRPRKIESLPNKPEKPWVPASLNLENVHDLYEFKNSIGEGSFYTS